MTALAFMGGHWEYLIILVVVLLLFGNRIPSMARSLGSGIVEFKRGLKEGEADNGSVSDGSQQAASNEEGASKENG
ncbi:MAG: twin-arginine translocase TatA/TatE family subunit [Planctomycetota bacterium]